MSNLIRNDSIARSLAQAIARGDSVMENAPGLLRRVITENMWQERIIPESGTKVCFSRFEDFVTTSPLEGLGTTIDVIKVLCKRDEDVLTLIDEVTQKTQHDGAASLARESAANNGSSSNTHQNNSFDYLVARLQRDGYAELASKVINREITIAEARRIVGYETRRIAISLDNPTSAAQTILKNMEPEAITELLSILAASAAQR